MSKPEPQYAPSQSLCGCCIEPVSDERGSCDLCSEATEGREGEGWRIRLCPVHAAAPEMLTVLNRALPWLCKAHAEGVHEGCVMPNDLSECIDQARDIIREVEGE